jgi:hypothetical protein
MVHTEILPTVSTVSLVAPLEAVLLNEDLEFSGKGPPSMMFFLTSNVVSHLPVTEPGAVATGS